MGELRCPANLKVHNVASNLAHVRVMMAAEENYALFSAYDYLGKGKMDAPMVEQLSKFKHVIQDSGLFTLLFGSKSGTFGREDIERYYDRYVRFCEENDYGYTCVEIDCQNLTGKEHAWELRRRLRNDLPGRRIINVFHYSDGRDGLDELIDYSDYIAFSVPEFRKRKCVYLLSKFVNIAKERKPTIDIHLLGCTAEKLLVQNKNCTSADSSSWTEISRWWSFGTIKGGPRKDLPQKFRNACYKNGQSEFYESLTEKGKVYNALDYGYLRTKRIFYNQNIGAQD